VVAYGAVVTEKPSPEVQDVLRKWCNLQRQKYGPLWKRKLAKEMAAKQKPVLDKILGLPRGRN
jgi:hypothetical protein